LTERLAVRHGVAPAQVVVGNGASELIALVAQALQPRRVAIAEPTYTEYLRASWLVGATAAHWLADEADDFEPAPFHARGADLVWLCNPNSPTGHLWLSGPRLLPWARSHRRSLFVVDESFLPFVEGEEHYSLIPSVNRLSNLVVVRSLTKVYALPGLRLGYAVTNADLAQHLRDHRVPWSVNTFAQTAGLAALDDDAFLVRTVRWLKRAAPEFVTALRAASPCLSPIATWAPFVLVRLNGCTAPNLTRRLAERGLAIRDASNFVGLGERYIRLAVGSPKGTSRLLDELRTLPQEGPC
jgi:threonine-phosphate decarboxylase